MGCGLGDIMGIIDRGLLLLLLPQVSIPEQKVIIDVVTVDKKKNSNSIPNSSYPFFLTYGTPSLRSRWRIWCGRRYAWRQLGRKIFDPVKEENRHGSNSILWRVRHSLPSFWYTRICYITAIRSGHQVQVSCLISSILFSWQHSTAHQSVRHTCLPPIWYLKTKACVRHWLVQHTPFSLLISGSMQSKGVQDRYPTDPAERMAS